MAGAELAFPCRRGEWRTGILWTDESAYTIGYELIEGLAVFQGDIILPIDERGNVNFQGTGSDPLKSAGVMPRQYWPDGKIYYKIDPHLEDQYRIADAIAHWKNNTALQFEERTNQSAYVVFEPGEGCSAIVGYTGGRQSVWLAPAPTPNTPGCATGAVIHEIGHTVGLWHEQSRRDRNQFVVIHKENIAGLTQEEIDENFDPYGFGFDYGYYDFESIMHYDSYAFADEDDPQPTITKLDGSIISANRNGLSPGDIEGIAWMYGPCSAGIIPAVPGVGQQVRHGIPFCRYQEVFDDMVTKGYRPVWVDGYNVDRETYFNAIFDSRPGGLLVAYHDLTGEEYQDVFDYLVAYGYRLTQVDSYLSSSGALRYAVIFVQQGGPAWRAYHGKTVAQHQALFDSYVAQGFRPVSLSFEQWNGTVYVTGLYDKANVGAWEAWANLTSEQYQTKFDRNTAAGRTLAYLNGYTVDGVVKFSAIWNSVPTSGWAARHGLTSGGFQSEFDAWTAAGYQTDIVTGYQDWEIARFGALWTRRVPDLEVPSLSLSMDSLIPGESFTINAVVRNNGSASSAATTLRYYRSTNSTISTSDTQIGTDSVTALAPSGTSPESIAVTAPTSTGTWWIGACVDAVGNELDTGNQCTAGVRITIESCDLYVPPVQPGFDQQVRHGIPACLFQKVFDGMVVAGYRPVWVDGYDVADAAYFNAIFESSASGPWSARHGLNGEAFQDAFESLVADGYRLTHVDGYVSYGELLYAAIFVQESGPAWQTYHGKTVAQHVALFDSLTDQGYRPVNLSFEEVNGTIRVAGLYDKKNVGAWQAWADLTAGEYQAEFDNNAAAGRSLAYLNGYTEDGVVKYSAIWNSTPYSSSVARHGLTASGFQSEFDIWSAAGYQTRIVTGYDDGGQASFGGFWTQTASCDPGLILPAEPGFAQLVRHAIPECLYQAVFDDMVDNGYRPVWVDGYDVAGTTYFNAIFESGAGVTWFAVHDLDGESYQDALDALVADGYRLTHVDAFPGSDGVLRYAGIFVLDDGPEWQAYHGMTVAQHEALFEDLVSQGFRPVNLSFAQVGGTTVVAGLYDKRDVGAWYARAGLTTSQYQTEFDDNTAAGRTLAFLDGYTEDGVAKLSAIWDSTSYSSWIAEHDLTASGFQLEVDTWAAAGYRTRIVTGYETGVTARFGALWTRGAADPDLTVPVLVLSGTSLGCGEPFAIDAVVKNDGTTASDSTTLRYYRSTNSIISTADSQVGTDPVAPLAPGVTSPESITVPAPASTGSWWIGACVDPVSDEADTGNQCSAGVQITVTAPDLTVPYLTVSPTSLSSGEPFSISATVYNDGTATSAATTLRYYRSADPAISPSDTVVGSDSVATLAAGGTSPESFTASAPAPTGTWWIGACVDAVAGESDPGNQCFTPGVQITVAAPDLTIPFLTVSEISLGAGQPFSVHATVRNDGTASSVGTGLRYYRSADATISTSDTQIGTDPVAALTPGGISPQSVTVSSSTPPGSWWIGACVDAVSGESDTSNQCFTPGVQIHVNAPPVVNITSPLSGSTFSECDLIGFAGTATDPEDGDLAAGLSWTSSLDGVLGAGASFPLGGLSPGSHTITASVVDSGGLSATDAISISVTAGPTVPIRVDNPSFEAPVLADGGWTHTMPSWDQITGTSGIFNPTSVEFPAGLPDGDNSAYINGGTIRQTVAAETLLANDVYRLSVDVGNRMNKPFPECAIQLVVDGVVRASAGEISTAPVEGTFVTATASFMTTPADAGRSLEIRLLAEGEQPNFDNVRLTRSVCSGLWPPVVTITSPADGSSLAGGTNIHLAATATDAEDGDMSSGLLWFSSLDGPLGSGPELETSTLSCGVHSITASVTDGDGLPGSDGITLTVTGGPAVPIPVANFSFEAPPLADGEWTHDMPSWTQIWPQVVGLSGIFDPTTAQFSAGVPDGDNSAYLNGAGIGQTIGAETLYARTTYTLSVDVGDRADKDFPGYAIQLVAGGGVRASADETSITPANGAFATATASFTTTPADAGQSLEIHLLAPGEQPNFDNVRLVRAACGGNSPPAVTITSPPDGSAFNPGTSVGFAATATDLEDGDLSSYLLWTSSLDGVLGSGPDLVVPSLSCGVHTITASATDFDGLAVADTITLTVGAPIEVANFSFEEPTLPDGEWTHSMPSWTQISGTSGIFNPTAVQFPAGVPDGSNSAYINGGAIGQEIAAETLLADVTYTLAVDVGDRADKPLPGCQIQLLVNGEVRANADETSGAPADGAFATATASFTATPADAGQSVEIRLLAAGEQPNFDNVRLMSSSCGF